MSLKTIFKKKYLGVFCIIIPFLFAYIFPMMSLDFMTVFVSNIIITFLTLAISFLVFYGVKLMMVEEENTSTETTTETTTTAQTTNILIEPSSTTENPAPPTE